MRPTRTGRIAAGLVFLTLFAALASGNNLLYLLYSVMVAAFAVSALLARRALTHLNVSIRFPDRSYADTDIRLRVSLRNDGNHPVHLIRAAHGGDSVLFDRLDPGETRTGDLSARLPHRGRNALQDLRLSTRFPFGLVEASLAVEDAVGTAVPRPREARDASELDADAEASGRAKPKKGAGEEIYGIRAYDESDDSRLINWKLSARTGKVLVNQFAQTAGAKVTIRVQGGSGPAVEGRIVAAASACAYYIGRGGEVRLETDEREVGYGKGLGHLDRLLEALALLGEGKSVRPAPPPTAEDALETPSRERLAWTWCGGVLVYAALFLIDEIPRSLLFGFGAVYPLGLWLEARKLRVPDWIWQITSAIILAYILLIDWHTSGITLANTHLLMYMIANRMLSPKGLVELRQIFLIYFLAFFLVSGQTVSMAYFPSFLLYSVFAGIWLMLAEREGRIDRRHSSAGTSRLPTQALAGALGGCLAAAGLAFAATPRIEPLRSMNPFIAMGLDKRRVSRDFVSGFTESVSLGWFGQLKKSSARVMRIKPLGNFRPASLRVRGMAFDGFTGRRWTRANISFRYRGDDGKPFFAQEGKAWARRAPNGLRFPGQAGGPAPAMEFRVFPMNSAVIFTAYGARTVDAPDAGAYFDLNDSLFFGSKYLMGVTYRVHGSPHPQRGYGGSVPGYDSLLEKLYLGLPRGLDPRVRRLAEEITRGAATPSEKGRAIVAYLSAFDYDLYSDDEQRSLEDFLFRSKRGNCEFFATAAAILLRASGVPARLVTGFLADDWNEYGEFFDVRQGQAHAWAEAWVGGEIGWMTIEATPPATDLERRTDAAWNKLRRWFSAAQYRWYRHVIGYDSFVQKDTFHRVRLALNAQALERAASRGARLGGWLALALALIAAIRVLVSRARRARTAGRFQRVERRLAERGFVRALDATPREFARTVLAQRPDLAPLEEFVELHYRERFSGRALPESETERADRLLAEIESALSDKRRTATSSRSPRSRA
ncbi:MAG: hypothetical protein CO113_06350 [Elusimicrobia bacterium CG_4_9_14_3_um_filter_62_55]|nr:MAG: hypothetical protein COR54_03360 [Elusimicrobia bacterium CG22_combo_CG10-13_8_21_14_all_63_91]PJA17717.1 MAG: hypothetical protein COX66_03390 [Elusimicrobia bacterium CG_4_10_14_0_2_um_filter_63_34]PJB25894.1 MAG: hypothetical protein CO113_06350 [Elusimicrobia bacterium CG_4_9_14_3_um_filter_62_55]